MGSTFCKPSMLTACFFNAEVKTFNVFYPGDIETMDELLLPLINEKKKTKKNTTAFRSQGGKIEIFSVTLRAFKG